MKIKSLKNSNLLRVFIFLFYAFFSIGLAILFSKITNFGVPPDETGHFNLISKYYNTDLFSFNISEPFIEYNLTGSNREPSLYHFGIGKFFSLFRIEPTYELIRNFNIILFGLYLAGLFFLLKEFEMNLIEFILYLLVTFHAVMIPFLFSSINYDNLVNVASMFILLFFIRLLKRGEQSDLFFLLFFSTIGILTKFTTLPLIFAISIALFIKFRNNFKTFMKLIIQSKKNIIISIIFIFFLTTYWGLNLLVYKTPIPSCDKIYKLEECKNNHIFIRRFEIYLDEQIAISPYSIDRYFYTWKSKVIQGIFGIFAHTSTVAPLNFSIILYYCFILGSILFLVKSKNPFSIYAICISIFYICIVFLFNFRGYIKTGNESLAVQGRYIFPVFPIIVIATIKGYSDLLNKFDFMRYLTLIFIPILIIFLHQNTFKYLFHSSIVNENQFSYSSNEKKIINTLNTKLPLIGPLEFWN